MGQVQDMYYENLNDTIGKPQTTVSFCSDSSEPVRHFKMRVNPFLDNVNPDFFFRTPVHEDAYIKMKKCIEDNIAIGITISPSGTGKTLLTQIILSELDAKKYKPIVILVYPQISKTGLLREIISELGINCSDKKLSVHELVTIIQDEIFRLYKEGIKLVIIIDEVHFLDGNCLHLIRTLSNIEIPEKKLLTILLFGEESFFNKLQDPKYKAVFSRMFVRAQLKALEKSEVEQYIKFRCLMAGSAPNIFSPRVFQIIADHTKGIPREINRICHNALLIASEARKNVIDESVILKAIAE